MTRKQPMRRHSVGIELGSVIATIIGGVIIEIGLYLGWW